MLQPLLSLYVFATAGLEAKRSEKGATATEYALIIAGIALVIFAAVKLFGEQLSDMWGDLGGSLSA